jgi:hypothetical protein
VKNRVRCCGRNIKQLGFGEPDELEGISCSGCVYLLFTKNRISPVPAKIQLETLVSDDLSQVVSLEVPALEKAKMDEHYHQRQCPL